VLPAWGSAHTRPAWAVGELGGLLAAVSLCCRVCRADRRCRRRGTRTGRQILQCFRARLVGSADTAIWHAHDAGSERQKQQLRKGWIDPSEEPALIGELEKIVRHGVNSSRLPALRRGWAVERPFGLCLACRACDVVRSDWWMWSTSSSSLTSGVMRAGGGVPGWFAGVQVRRLDAIEAERR
jgi:hypothetical protein